MDVREFTGKTVADAITAATVELGVTSDKLQYEVKDSGSSGFLGLFGAKPAVISVILKKSLTDDTKSFHFYVLLNKFIYQYRKFALPYHAHPSFV